MSEEEKAEFLGNISYFWHEKGDMERYIGFSIEKLREASPMLADAYERYQSAEATLNLMIEQYL